MTPENKHIAMNYSALVGYGGLSICGAFQWFTTLTTKSVEGISIAFLIIMTVSLVALQVSFRIGRALKWYQIGNAVCLFNAGMMVASYYWVINYCQAATTMVAAID
jgi:hypothetical protein